MNRRHRFVVVCAILIASAASGARPRGCWAVEILRDASLSSPADQSLLTECANSKSSFAWPQTWQLGPNWTAKLRGRIDTDAIWSSQSAANEAIFSDLGDVVGVRRARIGVEGDLCTGRYVWEIDLARGIVVARDVDVADGEREATGEWQLGHFREPFSQEGGTSARFFPFMERSPVNMLDPARNWGLGLYREMLDGHAASALGVFHAGTDDNDFQGGDGATVGFTGRLTTAPILENDGEQLLHFGVALSERVPYNGVIIINQQPRSPLLDLGDSSTSPFVPSIRIPATFQQLINVQFAAASGPVWTQAEWYGSLIDQNGGELVFFRGCHVDAGWFITGEYRTYDKSSGMMGGVRVNRPLIRGFATDHRPLGCGAWELTARFAYLDFIDSHTPPGPDGQKIGIALPQLTFGVNWYLTDRVGLLFNYYYDLPDEQNTGTTAASIFGTRLAVFW